MKKTMLANLLIGAGALMLWISSRLTWMTVAAADDKAGDKTVPLIGATWSTELMAVIILLAAGFLGIFMLRRVGRRIVGTLAAIVAAAGSWFALQVLLGGMPDPQRALSILSAGTANSPDKGAALSPWAQITDITVSPFPIILAIIGAALALMGGVIVAAHPGTDKPRKTQYERKQQREARIEEELETDPDSGRVLWDAIDADIDPTDEQHLPHKSQ
ncbi:MAG: TIGR02234 family membrane protein [Corynebacterium sp.]|nr:TIGR02234 family membrane protein [Corynebacterium sp.]